jgi:hypothetical protein
MRRISFALTTEQVLAQTKTVTRRFGWATLNPGDILQPIRKGMGLKKGEKQEFLGCPIEIISFRKEPIVAITSDDVIAEGFPDWSPAEFVAFLCEHHRVSRDTIVNRIEFRYLEPLADRSDQSTPQSTDRHPPQ